MMTAVRTAIVCVIIFGFVDRAGAGPQSLRASDRPVPIAVKTPAPVLPPGYLIGTDDVLSIVFWGDKDMSAEVTVRPDGKVALPLLNEIHAAGLTPEDLRDRVITSARKFIEDPNPTIIVRAINSRRVFITGQIEKPGSYPLNNSATVLQLIAMAGGLREFAKGKDISVLRVEGSQRVILRFNYQDVLNRKKLDQNIDLRPGDTVVVP